MSATRASSTPVRVRLMRRVVVWGTGNMGSTAIRSTLAFPGLELAAVITSAPDKAGRDAATFAGLTEDTGVLASTDVDGALAGCDAVAYMASGDIRPEDRKSTRLNSSHSSISYAVFCLKKKIL